MEKAQKANEFICHTPSQLYRIGLQYGAFFKAM